MRYFRCCPECNDVKELTHKPKEGSLCAKCSRIKNITKAAKSNWKRQEDKKVYWYFCPHCPSIRCGGKRKTSLCGDCSRKHAKRSDDYQESYTRTCSSCGDVRQVKQKGNSGNKLCKVCVGKLPKNRRSGMKYITKPKPTIDGLQKVTVKLKPEDIVAKAVNPVKPQSTEEDDRMIAEFLKKNKPSMIIEEGLPMPHIHSSCSLGLGFDTY
ncbi:hypothetical protein OAE88_00570 [bacterium]|nr:hypothetical protein [bacterium]